MGGVKREVLINFANNSIQSISQNGLEMDYFLNSCVTFATLLLTAPAIGAEEEPKWYDTTDHFAVHGVRNDDYGEYITIAIEGTENHYYMAYNLDIMLPAGVTFPITDHVVDGEYSYDTGEIFINNDDGIYPTTRHPQFGQMPNHTLANSIKDYGMRAKVICLSFKNEEFVKPTGSICNCYVKVHPLAKAGVNDVKMKDMVFNTKNHETGFPIQWAPGNTLWNVAWSTMTIPAERTVVINISATDKWSTLILPFGLTELPEDVTAYTAMRVNGSYEVELEAVTVIEPYKPYLINAPQGWTATLTGTASPDDFPSGPELLSDESYSTPFPADAIATNGVIHANIKPHNRIDGYVLTAVGDAPAFTRITNETPKLLLTGDVYIPMSGDVTDDMPDSLPLKVVKDSPSTGINQTVADDASQPAPIYNLQGIRVSNPLPGNIYICSGKLIRK